MWIVTGGAGLIGSATVWKLKTHKTHANTHTLGIYNVKEEQGRKI